MRKNKKLFRVEADAELCFVTNTTLGHSGCFLLTEYIFKMFLHSKIGLFKTHRGSWVIERRRGYTNTILQILHQHLIHPFEDSSLTVNEVKTQV